MTYKVEMLWPTPVYFNKLQSDKNDLDLTDNQIKVLQDSVLEDNLNTILAPVVEAKPTKATKAPKAK